MERTLAIIKPDAVAARQVGAILRRIELAGFTLREIRLVKLSRHDAEGFYAVHRTKPFFDSLGTFMGRPIVGGRIYKVSGHYWDVQFDSNIGNVAAATAMQGALQGLPGAGAQPEDLRGLREVSRFESGRASGGEERYYKLSMVRRERSADRLSADRLSL